MGILQAHTLFPLLTERNAPACRAENTQQKTRLSAFFDCGSNPHLKAPSCAFNGAERACTPRKNAPTPPAENRRTAQKYTTKNPPFGGF